MTGLRVINPPGGPGQDPWAARPTGLYGLVAEGYALGHGLGRAGTLQDGRVRYSLADVGPVVRYDWGRGLRLSASAGISFRRRLEVKDAEGRPVEDAALSQGWRMGIGLSWMLPEDPG